MCLLYLNTFHKLDAVKGDLAVFEEEIQSASLLLAIFVLRDLNSVFIYDSCALVRISLDTVIEASVL